MKIIHILLGKANPNRLNGVNNLALEMHAQQLDVKVWGLTPTPQDNIFMGWHRCLDHLCQPINNEVYYA